MDKPLTNTEPRIYQQVIFSECVSNPGNTLVVLPTGLGKTVIMAYLAAYYLKNDPNKQILIITPTRPLVHQIKEILLQFIGNITPEMVLEVSGEIPPKKRQSNYPNAKIIVATPQTIENDLTYDRLQIQSIGLLCIDEVHRATGDYAYVGIAAQAKCQIIGFTATPGNNPEKILEVCENLKITKISYTDTGDLDVNKYVSIHTPKVIWIELPSEYESVLKNLQNYQDELMAILKDRIPMVLEFKYLGKREALGIHQHVVKLTKEDPKFGDLLIQSSNLIRIQHLQELVESQGFPQAFQSLQKWRRKASSKALRLFLEDNRIISIEKSISKDLIVHPKLQELINEIKNAQRTASSTDSKIIVFSNYRDTVRFLHTELSKLNFKAGLFVGHSSSRDDKGLTQKEQLSVIEEFKDGELDILISTSVGEEGLDVGNCDLVVFYDSVPSVVRAIQRRGRGRKKKSRVIHLVTKKTRDEAMYWAIKRKDKQMKEFLKNELPQLLDNTQIQESQRTLDQFFKSNQDKFDINDENSALQIIVDAREASGGIPKILKRQGIRLTSQKLDVGDYILSNRLVVELKTYSDFINSIIDGRLFRSTSPGSTSQLLRLSKQKLPLIIIQRESEPISQQIHINSIMGAISSIILDFKIPIVFTHNDLETAALLSQLAKREQTESPGQVQLPPVSKIEHSIKEIQLFMLSTIPGINIEKAKALLGRFKTIQEIGLADLDEIIEVPQIGKKLAIRIKTVLTSPGNDKTL
ncbi:MAG: DEAD/DEAH box helicase family protein [Candidatus Hodarchaeota archaeon]